MRDGVGWPHYGWMPDGHMSALWDNATARWLTFYPNHESFRWEGLRLATATGVTSGDL